MEDTNMMKTAVVAGASALLASLTTWYLTRPAKETTTAKSELPPNFEIAANIQKALAAGEPIVALESTVITHGMEFPQNKDTALALEKIIRDNGAIPATIAIIGGVVKIGLTEDEIVYLAKEGK